LIKYAAIDVKHLDMIVDFLGTFCSWDEQHNGQMENIWPEF